jgi:hypothetical protein
MKIRKIKLPNGFVRSYSDVSEMRARVAEMVTNIIDGRAENGVPYRPNGRDDTYWTVDSGNDWKIKFDEQEIGTFELIFRYSDKEGKLTESLARWIAYKLGGNFLEEAT